MDTNSIFVTPDAEAVAHKGATREAELEHAKVMQEGMEGGQDRKQGGPRCGTAG